MRQKLANFVNLLKENRLCLSSVAGIFFILMLCDYFITKNLFEKSLRSEVTTISNWAENMIKSNMENLETNFYEDAIRIERYINETDDFSRVENFIRLSAYKKVPFSDKLDTTHIYGVLKGNTFASTQGVKVSLSSVENSPWYRKAIEADGDLARNPPYTNFSIYPNTLISWSKELFDKSKKSIGVINLAMSFDSYISFFNDLTKFEDGYVILTDTNDIILNHKEKSYIGHSIIKANVSLTGLLEDEAKEVSNYQNLRSYVLKRKIFNDWNIYVVVPLAKHYQEGYVILVQTALVFLICLVFLSFLLIKLNMAGKEAIMENEAKSNFLTVMSHEIRTPLNAIIGLGQLELEDKNLPRKSRNNIEKILISSNNLLGIINDILDLSKIEHNKFEIVPEEYDVPSLINDICIISQARMSSKSLDLQLSVSPDIPNRFFGDMQRIKQILNNFVSNAVKYTSNGFVKISVSYLEEQDKTSLKFDVKDSGIGIKTKDVSKLFTAYNRFDSEKNKTIEGTGLGLSITKKLTDMMGGFIDVKSTYGKGSEFTVVIPQTVKDSKPIGKEIADRLENFKYIEGKTVANKSFVRADLNGKTVLVVDDVVMNLDVIRGLLDPYNLKVETVTSGQEAISLLKSGKRYDIIFLDHMMPAMDGIETARIIRDLDGYAKKVPIVAFTANAMAGNSKMFLEKNFNDFISKPIDIRKLDACLNKWLRKKAKEQEADDDSDDDDLDGDDGEETFMDKGIAQFGSKEAFVKVLASFKEHMPQLLKDLQEKTENDYTIAVHALKGCARTIFANDIGDRAYELELASKEGNWELVKSKNEALIKDTQKLIDSITLD